MMTTQLTAVPQPPATFRERALAALETHQGADLVGFLAMIHEQLVAEVVEQAASARDSVAQVAMAAAVDQQILASVLDTVRPMLRTSGENAARARHWAGVIVAVRSLLHEADSNGVTVASETLRRLLNDVATPAPAFRPLVIGFVPSTQYRVGHFRHVSTNAEVHLPFSGFQMCEESEEGPMTVHVSFLHKGAVRPRPALYAEHGLVMEHME